MANLRQSAHEVSVWRREFPQYLFGMSMSLIAFNIGLSLSYPTLLINAFLVGKKVAVQESNSSLPFEDFTLSENEATLYVSLAYLCQPIGSILGGLIIQKIGRKKVMIMFNIPIFLGWITLFCSQSADWLYASNVLVGISLGLSEAPFATYVGETTEPHLRGIIVGIVLAVFTFSFMMPYLIALGTGGQAWRWIALYQGIVPLVTLAYTLMIPETPAWLISKGRLEEAKKSLRALRGWKDTPSLEKEFSEAISFHQSSIQASNPNFHSTAELIKPNTTLWDKLAVLLRKRMLQPLGTICALFAVIYLTGLSSIRPYLGPVMSELHLVGSDPNLAEEKTQYESMVLTLVGAIGTVVGIGVMKITGKRFLYIFGLGCCALTCVLLSLGASSLIPPSVSLWSLYFYSFFTGFAIIPIPWMLQCDLYPFEGRGIASGLAAAFNYLVGFLATLIAMDVLRALTATGMFAMFAGFTGVAMVFAYVAMPETEGKSLQEIDAFYRKST